MEKVDVLGSEVYEGTWEELSHVASKFNGHKLRVMVLDDDNFSPIIQPHVPGGYAKYALEEISKLPPATDEEVRETEAELLELKKI